MQLPVPFAFELGGNRHLPCHITNVLCATTEALHPGQLLVRCRHQEHVQRIPPHVKQFHCVFSRSSKYICARSVHLSPYLLIVFINVASPVRPFQHQKRNV